MAEKEYEYLGETAGCPDHVHDLIHELSKKLDALWRYDQYIANASSCPNAKDLESLWRDFKAQCQADVQRLRTMIAAEIQKGCF
jgi:hypothetical protein